MLRLGYPLLNAAGITHPYIRITPPKVPTVPQVQKKRKPYRKHTKSRADKTIMNRGTVMQDEELLTVDEAAEIMKVHPRTIRGFVNAGQLAVVRIGKREYRIRRSELNRFIREREERKS